MKHLLVIAILVFGVTVVNIPSAYSQSLIGTPGSAEGHDWASSWIDLSTASDFKSGEKLRLRVGGTAENILVRFLPKGASPGSPVGIEGGVVLVPKNKTVAITLQQDHLDIKQISVHGGQKAWSYALGGGNGPVTLISVERVVP